MQETKNTRVIDEELKERSTREYRWLVWLLKVWDDNGKRPSWLTIKRNWPDEYQSILRDVGPWDITEHKLNAVYEIRERNSERQLMREVQRSHVLQEQQGRYSIEDCILGLIKLMDYLQIKRLPSLQEISEHAKRLKIPHASTYGRALVSKDNWMPCIQKYQAASPEQREEVLREIEAELLKQRQGKWQARREQEGKTAVCLETLRRIYEYYGCIPTRREICKFTQEHNLVRAKTLYTYLGPMDQWPEILQDYLTEYEAEQFLQNYGSLKIANATPSIDSLLRKAQRVASVAEEAEWKETFSNLRKSTKKKPAIVEFEFEGRKYTAKIMPK